VPHGFGIPGGVGHEVLHAWYEPGPVTRASIVAIDLHGLSPSRPSTY
jgi:hypothetical protein